MRPIRKGDRGAAVEDVQRRLLTLGAALGAAGVDGVFLGATYSAVVSFQKERGLAEDGEVGPETWAALVDATFRLGDRLIYLRFPYLHGADVRALQSALNALGFVCGEPDGIFGAFTERAVREFQANSGLAADGIAGPDTVRAVEHLRHVWVDKNADPPAALRAAPARSAECLRRTSVSVDCSPAAVRLAERLVNTALAAEPLARVTSGESAGSDGLTLAIDIPPGPGTPVVVVADGGPSLARRLAAAIAAGGAPPTRICLAIDDVPSDEHGLQAIAVALLDGVCAGIVSLGNPVVP
ncbi:MAG: peptidoglycan-binding protein [Coriobacteriia bacterium]|nr:peptidoglycan-binding protein [Coriobacteriia bacterium]